MASPAVPDEDRDSKRDLPKAPTKLQAQSKQTTYAEKAPEPKRSLAEELLGMLQEQAKPADVSSVRLPAVDDEAQSLETLEPGERDSHERFREQYVEEEPVESPYSVEDAPAPRPYAIDETPDERPYMVEETTTPQPYAISATPRRRKHLSRSELRHAFVMREVLGPPKALEE
jgi:hypothetical protein